jgi:hypothetical protein
VKERLSRPIWCVNRLAVAALAAGVCLALGGVSSCSPPPCGAIPCGKTTLGIFTPRFTNVTDAGYVTTEARALGVQTVRMSQQVTQPPRSAFNVFERNGMDVVATMINGPTVV